MFAITFVHISVPLLAALPSIAHGYRLDKHIQPMPEHSLQNDLMEFVDLIPQEDINQLTKHYYINDPEIRSTYNFLASIDFKIIRAKIFQLPEVRELMEYFGNCGVNVMEIMDRLGVIMQAPKVAGAISTKKVTTKGMNGLMDDILELLPQDEIVGLFFEKLETSNDFSVFFERIGSGDFERVIDALKTSPELQQLLTVLRSNGVDFEKCIELMEGFFGFDFK